MATQRLTVATIAGEAGRIVVGLFHKWQRIKSVTEKDVARSEVDEFAEQLQGRFGIPPIVYYCEWLDYWSMGDSIHFGTVVEGKQFGASCGSRREAMAWAKQNRDRSPEQQWLATRLREASEAWLSLSEQATIVILRQVLGPSLTDEEVMASLANTTIFSHKSGNPD